MKTKNIEADSIKLTPKQNSVIWCMQNGWELITDNDVKGAWVCSKTLQYHINNGIFFRLVQMDLIYQGSWKESRFGFILTPKGKQIKTKKVTF